MTTKPFVRNPYNYDMNQAGNESGLDCRIVPEGEEVIRTKQSFAEECDINTIVKRFNLTGQLPQAVHMPTYADFVDVIDYKTAMDAITRAHSSFMEMPAHIRARFDNDPQRFVEFCSDDQNRDEALALGMLDQAAVDAQAAAAAQSTGGTTTPPVDNSATATTTPAKP